MRLTDDAIVGLLRQAYTAIVDAARSDPDVAKNAGVGDAMTAITDAGNTTQEFLKRFRQHQAGRFADELPSYNDPVRPTE